MSENAQNQDEITAQPAASEEGVESTQQTLPSSDEGQSVSAEDLGIPKKFVGKSSTDIIQAYTALEKDRGRLASEVGSVRKEREELEAKYRELEKQAMRYQPMPTQVPPQTQAAHVPQEQDPLSVFDSKFDEDPKAAIKEAMRHQYAALNRQTQEQSLQQRAYEAQEWYWKQKRENPDYARREQLMQQAVQQYSSIIRPEYLNSVQVLQALDMISRGMDIDYYRKNAAAEAAKNGSSIRQEKLRAQSESASSEGEQKMNFRDLSLKDMEKLLGERDE